MYGTSGVIHVWYMYGTWRKPLGSAFRYCLLLVKDPKQIRPLSSALLSCLRKKNMSLEQNSHIYNTYIYIYIYIYPIYPIYYICSSRDVFLRSLTRRRPDTQAEARGFFQGPFFLRSLTRRRQDSKAEPSGFLQVHFVRDI